MQATDGYDRENARHTFEAIARDTLANGGGTYRRETGARVDLSAVHGTGYVVGVAPVARGTIEALTLPVRRIIVAGILEDAWPTTAPANAQYVGTWIDTDTDTLYIDHVTVIRDLSVALSRLFTPSAFA